MRETRVLLSALTIGIVSLAAAHASSVTETAPVSQVKIEAIPAEPQPSAQERLAVERGQKATTPTLSLSVDDHASLHIHAADVREESTLLSAVDHEDIQERHRIIADETLRVIDARCREHLTDFYVRYDNPKSRGLGGGSTIILSGNVSDDEFRALLIHECAHVIDTGSWNGTAAAGVSAFTDHGNPIYEDDPSLGFYRISWIDEETKKEGSKKEDFASGYGAWNPFEDFAESFALFTLHKGEFLRRAQANDVMMQKYLWLSGYVGQEEEVSVLSGYAWDGTVPWDITKLAYRWMAEAVTAR